MYAHDADEVLKVGLSDRGEDDCLEWHYERSGLFSVRSAYKLALEVEQEGRRQVGSSSVLDGSRSLYKELWATKVPPKVCIFAWKLSQEGLATQCNRKKRTLTTEATCQICGREEESGYHAVIHAQSQQRFGMK
jgi:hypothetical protein